MLRKGRYFGSRYVRFVSQTLFWAPMLVAIVAACLLAFVPQMSEVYLGIVEDADLPRGLLGLAAVALFCAFLYVWNQSLASRRIDAIYPEHADIYFDRDILKIRDLKAAAVAMLPIFGLLVGLVVLYGRVRFAHEDVGAALKALNDTTTPAAELLGQLGSLPAAVLSAAALVLVAGFGLVSLLYAARDNSAAQLAVQWTCYAIAASLLLTPLAAPEATLTFARLIGPLAACGAVLTTVAVFARLIAYLARIVAGALLSVIAAALMSVTALPTIAKRIVYLGAGVAVLALLVLTTAREAAPPQAVAVLTPEGASSLPQETEISRQFGDWLAGRKDRSAGRYPVFIVAAQGGGIYAASTVASFLASMQDRCPQFAQHIFAISGVSGGAIGASIFDAMMQGVPQDGQRGCSDTAAPRMAAKVRQIVLADHLAPIILELAADALSQPLAALFGNAAGFKDTAINRAGMLERSFAQSFALAGAANAANGAGRGLETPFSKHWSPQGAAPALLLNATWVETGYRVAFSPFPLQPVSDGTLYGLAELKGAGGLALQDMSLIQASSVSARFPLILPSWTIFRNTKQLFSANRWTLVDGGYADGSGSNTALDVFNAVKARAALDNAELYMILLTNAAADPEFSKIGSTWFDDYIAPVRTVMKVRDLLGWRAVTQARSQLGDKVITLQLDHRAFPLPMGWKISRASNALIEFMSGRVDGCRELKGAATQDPVQFAVTTITSNSCKLSWLLALLGNKPN